MKIPDYTKEEKKAFREALEYHESFLQRKIRPFEEENDRQRREGLSFIQREPIRSKIAEIDKTLKEIQSQKKRT